MAKTSTINSQTLIPLSALSVLVGGIFWLSVLYSDVQTVIHEIDEAKVFRMKLWDQQMMMDRRLSRIEGKLLEITISQ